MDRPRSFHELEQAGWSDDRVAERYHLGFGSLTTQAIPALLDAAGVGPGTRLCDLATGPGYVAAAAASRGALVSAIDFSPAMVAQARRTHPGIDVREADAQALPFADGSFDAVVTNFGMLHFADPERVLREAHRVLVPSGRLAFTVWAPPDRAVVFQLVQRAIEAHADPAAPPLPEGPAFGRFSDAGECLRTLARCGFEDGRVVVVPQTWRLGSVDDLVSTLMEGTVRNRARIRAQGPERAQRIAAEIRERAAAYTSPDGRVTLPMPAVLSAGIARKSE